MSAKLLISSAIALACLCATTLSHAQHDVRAYLSRDGMDFMAREAPSFLPTVFVPPDFEQAAGCVDFKQKNTTINFSIDDLTITVPRSGRVRVEMDFSTAITGEIDAIGIYLCGGALRCNDDIIVRKGNAVFEYDISILDGDAQAVSKDIVFTILPEDVDLSVSECVGGESTGETFNDLFEFSKEWLLIAVESTLTDFAEENLGPYLEGLFGGFNFDGTVGIASYNASLQDLDVEADGMRFRINGDMIDPFSADPCIAEFDNGSPSDLSGLTPTIDGPNASHIGLAFNLGMVNKALYTIWRRGLLCLSDDHVRAIGVDLDLEMIGALLPGFPAGTELSLALKMSKPPLVRPEESEGSTITIEIQGILLDMHGDRPDGSRNTLHIEIDAEATATLSVDRTTNAIIAHLDSAKIFRMVLEDERDAAGAGFDVARIIELVEDHILPDLLDEAGTFPLTGPAFTFEKYALILRNLFTNDAFLSMGIDLFRIPDVDNGFPDTAIIESPSGPTSPTKAIVRVLGDDAEIPTELLQYQVSIDGVTDEPTFIQSIQVGEAGLSKTYRVSVAAVDFAGNIDPTPAEVDVIVDGISPTIALLGPRTRPANKGAVDITWNMSDDLTSSGTMAVRVETYELVDPADSLSAVLIDSKDLSPGATSTQVEIAGSKRVYRVEIHAFDEAGNDSIASMLLTNPKDGGCSVGGIAGQTRAGLWFLVIALLALRRRRVSAQ